VVVLAQEEARMLNHNYIGTEHILLGLIHEGVGWLVGIRQRATLRRGSPVVLELVKLTRCRCLRRPWPDRPGPRRGR
ncbi:hypothetical protein CH258_02735, partial [Rhodococcus sp. 05-2256-B4]